VLCYWLGAFATRQGRPEQAAAAYQEAVELFGAADDTTRVAKTLNALGAVAVSQGDHAEARRCWNEALTRGAAGAPLGDHQRTLLTRALRPASAALGRDVLATGRRRRRGPGHDLRPGARRRHRLVRPARQRIVGTATDADTKGR
jgi:tetratricopeptide (TPR) repeat protein